jgi:two-component system, OmpR family, response regulator
MNLPRKRTILAVDDDQKTRQLLKLYLEKHQYVVQLAADGESFRSGFERYRDELSLVILDVMLPDTDGFALCQMVRQRAPMLPIIMLTASADDTERIVGLELGADDYIGKPYNPRELLARIKAIHRRAGMVGEGAPRYLSFSGFRLDRLERTLTAPDGKNVTLTAMDFDLLRLFAEHPGEVLDRARLMEQTRGRDLGPTDRSLDVQVSRLRQRVGDDGKQPSLIKTVRSSGYVFSVEVQASHE